MSENEFPNYQVLAEKILNLIKGENYDDVEKAFQSLMDSLKRRSIIN